MSDPLLEEYKAYYKSRGERYESNENYKHSYAAEQKLAEAMLGCNELIEFKDQLGDKNVKCAIALILDQYEMRLEFYEELKEVIHLEIIKDIIREVVKAVDAMDVVTVVSEIETKGGVKISMDQAHRQFHTEWGQLDNIEIYESAEVPNNYKSKLQGWADGHRANLVESNESLEENNIHWQPGWRHAPELVIEYRNRRLLPYSDQHIEEQLAKYRKIINR